MARRLALDFIMSACFKSEIESDFGAVQCPVHRFSIFPGSRETIALNVREECFQAGSAIRARPRGLEDLLKLAGCDVLGVLADGDVTPRRF